MTEPKLCPLKSTTEESVREQLTLMLAGEDEVGLIGKCDGPRCAWWDAERNCCGVVTGRSK